MFGVRRVEKVEAEYKVGGGLYPVTYGHIGKKEKIVVLELSSYTFIVASWTGVTKQAALTGVSNYFRNFTKYDNYVKNIQPKGGLGGIEASKVGS